MSNTHHEYLVLGAGPAGVQTGYFLKKNNRDYVILERNEQPASFFNVFPRHRKLISINKVYTGYDNVDQNMRWDWNSLISDDPSMLLKEFTKKYFPDAGTLVDYVQAFTEHFELNVNYGCSILSIDKNENGLFVLTTDSGDTYTCKYLIVGTGMSKPYIPEISGIELCENYFDVSVDPDDFINQSVLIIGKGNSAFETADNLIETTTFIHMISPTPINFAWRTHYVGHLRAVNNNFLDTYQLKSQNGLINGEITKVEKTENGKFKVFVNYSSVSGGETEELEYDRIIGCCGFKFDNSIFSEKVRPEMVVNERFPSITCEWESTNVPGMFFIGAPTHGIDYKKATSGFIHGFRYNAESLVKILMHNNHDTHFARHAVDLTSENVTDIIIERMNISSALWQQFGFFGDLVVLDQNNREARYYDALPVDFIHKTMMEQDDDYLVVTLEYGKSDKDPFDHSVERINRFDVNRAKESVFLHPVIRRYNQGKFIDEIHLIEDFKGEFNRREEHIKPLQGYLSKTLKEDSVPV